MNRRFFTLATVALVGCSGAPETSAQAPTSGDSQPTGIAPWTIAGLDAGAHYRAFRDAATPHAGHATIAVSPSDARTDAWGGVSQRVGAAPFAGHRVRLTLAIRTSTGGSQTLFVAGTWNAAAIARQNPLTGQNVDVGPGTPFADYAIELDVPSDATEIELGVNVVGPGTLWIDDLRIERL